MSIPKTHASQAPRPPLVSGIFFFSFFCFMVYESSRLFWPFMGSIGSAIVLAIVFRPWYNLLGKRFPRLSPAWRAFLLDILVAILFIIPVVILIWSAASEIQDLYPRVMERMSHAEAWLHQSPTQSFPLLKQLPPALVSQLDIRSVQAKQQLAEAGQKAFAVTAGLGTLFARRLVDVALDLVILVFCLFFFFRDGSTIYRQAEALIPLSEQSKERLRRTLQKTIIGVVRGTLLMSVAQTCMMAVGLLVVQAQAIVLLSFLTFAATFIPTVGTALISIPAALYFLFTGVKWKGIFLLLWGTLGMGIVDNVLRPFLVGAGEEMSFFWLFFAVLGGLETFGIPGLLLGPLILSLMPVIFAIYRERYLDIPEDPQTD